MTKKELNNLIKNGGNIQAKAIYSDSSIFIGMVNFEHGINDSMLGYIVYNGGLIQNLKAFKRKVYHTENDSYIKINDKKLYFSEFLRTNLVA